jgi:GT2 family glycosyltransferase
VFQVIGGFDENFFMYSEETDLCLRAKRQGCRIFFFPDAAIIHLGGQSSIENRVEMFGNIHRGKLQFYRKHFSGFELLMLILLQYTAIILRVIVYFLGGIFLFKSRLIKKSWHFLLSLARG